MIYFLIDLLLTGGKIRRLERAVADLRVKIEALQAKVAEVKEDFQQEKARVKAHEAGDKLTIADLKTSISALEKTVADLEDGNPEIAEAIQAEIDNLGTIAQDIKDFDPDNPS